MERVELDGWTLAGAGIDVPATVPGCVHTDLLAAGLIPDPFVDDNELRVAWVSRAEWTYRTTFQKPPGRRIDLAADGLDTVATIRVNGTEVGRTANMHRRYRFDLRDVLRDGNNTNGANELSVTFTPAYDYAEQQRDRLGDRPGAYDQPYPFVRKMACNFGWDWGPTVVTAGIYRPIALETWSVARLATVRPLVTVDGGTGRVRVEVDVERDTNEPLVVTAAVAGTTVQGPPGEPLELQIEHPGRWWPRGYGDQPRYDLAVTLTTAGGEPLDSWHAKIGFRDVRLDTTPDEHGTPYTLVVNDVPVFVRGFNWIPDDAFVSRVTRDRYAQRLTQAVEADANYLRVWGGGLYESDDFYDLADEYGLLVGQDFLFACGAYPEEEPFASEVAAEARANVTRLASHPGLVLWTGNNENIWGWHDWGWQEPLAGRTWGAGFYFDLLPRIVAELDPTRPYWPGSPWSGGQWSGGQWSGSHDRHPNDPAHGTTHEWRVWNQVDYAHYRDQVPRFMSEFGYQAPPAYATLRRYLSDDPLAPDSPGMAHHQKAIGGDAKLERGLSAHLPVPQDFDDWHYLTQVNQARAVALGVAHYRSHRPVCMGTIVWQLNDTWPATSWAAVDVDGRRKPLWHALRRLYADRILTIEPRDAGLALVAVNESATPWSGTASISLYTVDGTRVGGYPVEVAIPARSSATVPLTVEGSPDLAVADLGGQRAWWFFTEDKDLRYPRPRLAADVTPIPGGVAVTITAGTILRDLTLYPDRLDPAATVDDALVTLLPGESATFRVHTAQQLDPAALTSRPVLRCVNDVGR